MPQLVSLLTNVRLGLDLKTKIFTTKYEIIILYSKPIYVIKDNKIVEEKAVSELMFTTNESGIKNIIEQLTALNDMIGPAEDMSSALNDII